MIFQSTRRSRRHRNPHAQEDRPQQPFFTHASDTAVQTKEDSAFFQPRLRIGQPGDQYEREADSMADAVVNQSGSPAAVQEKAQGIQKMNDSAMEKDRKIQEKSLIQRAEAMEGDEEEPIRQQPETGGGEKMEEEPLRTQPEAGAEEKMEEEPLRTQPETGGGDKMEEEPLRTQPEAGADEKMEEGPLRQQPEAGGGEKMEEEQGAVHAKRNENAPSSASPRVSRQIHQSRGKGKPMPTPVRAGMETAFGADFSGVNIHTDAQANEMNHELGAQAFTHGQDIYFNAGKYHPESSAGKHLLAHELTHVVQQKQEIKKKPDQAKTGHTPAGQTDKGGAAATSSITGSGPVVPIPPYCPAEFCSPFPDRQTAELARAASADLLLAGIAVAVNPRVVFLWHKYIFGGTAPLNLSGIFGADFTQSETTRQVSGFLADELVKHLQSHPPTFPPGVSTVTLDIATLIPAAITAIGTPNAGPPKEMNFNKIGEIPGNIAGGIGRDQLKYPVGAKPSPFNDSRTATGKVIVSRNTNGSLTIEPLIRFTVRDTIDLCPGDCGADKEMLATVPLSMMEASGISGDVPFEVNFPAPDQTRTTAPGIVPPGPVGSPATGRITASRLRIRALPNTSSTILGRYDRGASILIDCQVNGEDIDGVTTWYKTADGFVSGRYVNLISPHSVSNC